MDSGFGSGAGKESGREGKGRERGEGWRKGKGLSSDVASDRYFIKFV